MALGDETAGRSGDGDRVVPDRDRGAGVRAQERVVRVNGKKFLPFPSDVLTDRPFRLHIGGHPQRDIAGITGHGMEPSFVPLESVPRP